MFGKTTVPSTISDQQMADLSRRAQQANPSSMFSDQAISRRAASNAQQRKADQS